jgi:hypothetical protein
LVQEVDFISISGLTVDNQKVFLVPFNQVTPRGQNVFR